MSAKANPAWKDAPYEALVATVKRRGSRPCLYSGIVKSAEEMEEFFKNPDTFGLKYDREVNAVFL